MDIEYQKPKEIEERSMRIIESEMTTRPPRYHAPVVRRVIHTTADFDYEQNLLFSETAVASALAALRGGRKNRDFVPAPDTDTGKLRELILSSVRKNSAMDGKTATGGMLDAGRAMELAGGA